MKYKVRLYEKTLKEVTFLKSIKGYLSNPKAMRKLIDDPSSLMDFSIRNSKGKEISISSKKDIIYALSAEKLLPPDVLKVLYMIKDDGYTGLNGREPPAKTVDKTIDIFLSKYPLYATFLNLFVPDSGAGTKPFDKVQGSYDINKDNRDMGRKDIFDQA